MPKDKVELVSVDKIGQFGPMGKIGRNFLGGLGLASTKILGSGDDLLLDLIGLEWLSGNESLGLALGLGLLFVLVGGYSPSIHRVWYFNLCFFKSGFLPHTWSQRSHGKFFSFKWRSFTWTSKLKRLLKFWLQMLHWKIFCPEPPIMTWTKSLTSNRLSSVDADVSVGKNRTEFEFFKLIYLISRVFLP